MATLNDTNISNIRSIGEYFYAYSGNYNSYSDTEVYRSANGKDWLPFVVYDGGLPYIPQMIAGDSDSQYLIAIYAEDFGNPETVSLWYSENNNDFTKVVEFDYNSSDHPFRSIRELSMSPYTNELILKASSGMYRVTPDGTYHPIDSNYYTLNASRNYLYISPYTGELTRIDYSSNQKGVYVSDGDAGWERVGDIPEQMSIAQSASYGVQLVNNQLVYRITNNSTYTTLLIITDDTHNIINEITLPFPVYDKIMYVNNMYFIRPQSVSGVNSIRMQTSTDLETWTLIQTNIYATISNQGFSVGYAGSTWFLRDGLGRVYRNSDMVAGGWAQVATDMYAPGTFEQNDNVLLYLTSARNAVKYTTDGVTWNTENLPTTLPQWSVYSLTLSTGEIFFYTRYKPNRIVSTMNGSDWTTHTAPEFLDENDSSEFLIEVHNAEVFQLFYTINSYGQDAPRPIGTVRYTSSPVLAPEGIENFAPIYFEEMHFIKDSGLMINQISEYSGMYYQITDTHISRDWSATWSKINIGNLDNKIIILQDFMVHEGVYYHAALVVDEDGNNIELRIYSSSDAETWELSTTHAIELPDNSSISSGNFPLLFEHNGNKFIAIIPVSNNDSYETYALILTTVDFNIWLERLIVSGNQGYSWEEIAMYEVGENVILNPEISLINGVIHYATYTDTPWQIYANLAPLNGTSIGEIETSDRGTGLEFTDRVRTDTSVYGFTIDSRNFHVVKTENLETFDSFTISLESYPLLNSWGWGASVIGKNDEAILILDTEDKDVLFFDFNSVEPDVPFNSFKFTEEFPGYELMSGSAFKSETAWVFVVTDENGDYYTIRTADHGLTFTIKMHPEFSDNRWNWWFFGMNSNALVYHHLMGMEDADGIHTAVYHDSTDTWTVTQTPLFIDIDYDYEGYGWYIAVNDDGVGTIAVTTNNWDDSTSTFRVYKSHDLLEWELIETSPTVLTPIQSNSTTCRCEYIGDGIFYFNGRIDGNEQPFDLYNYFTDDLVNFTPVEFIPVDGENPIPPAYYWKIGSIHQNVPRSPWMMAVNKDDNHVLLMMHNADTPGE